MEEDLYHYGVKGMKWGVRRSQKKDGTRISRGQKRDESSEKDVTASERISRAFNKGKQAVSDFYHKHPGATILLGSALALTGFAAVDALDSYMMDQQFGSIQGYSSSATNGRTVMSTRYDGMEQGGYRWIERKGAWERI